MTDSEMIDMFINGDKNAFGLLYDKYVSQAVRTAYLITHNSQLSRDIAQETFVKCYLELNNLKNKEVFKSWFFKILVRTAWEMDNKNKASVPVSEIYDMADKAVYDSDRSDFELLYKAVNALNQKQKMVTFPGDAEGKVDEAEIEKYESEGYMISYGDGVEKQESTVESLYWTDGDLIYSMIGLNTNLGEEEFLSMKNEIME